MNISELLEDLQSLGIGNAEILLATRQVEGELMANPKYVHLREIARIEIDDGDFELKVVPKSLARSEGDNFSHFSIESLKEFIASNPSVAAFEVLGVDRRGLLDDGSVISLNVPILGVCQGAPAEAWLLLAPQDQWPASWFGTTVSPVAPTK